ncbi:MAG: hypothetical protein N2205_01170, partial [Candidatus Caldatribacterium sp.]|nr:hypothetical protein [Candidatus Caldatribacterium sp.]
MLFKGRVLLVVGVLAMVLGGFALPSSSQEVVIHYLTVQQENEGWPKIIGELTKEYAAQRPDVA